MSVEQQLQHFDFDSDRDEDQSGSKALDVDTCSMLAEAIGGWDQVESLSRNTSLTTVCSTFPLTSRIESQHRWDGSQGPSRIMQRESMQNCLVSHEERVLPVD
ncbi:hypothetical protein KR009_001876 [Drosophila setifemur]|nr:hypothetical protein KR009_001876 [Drosophila setifemur]